MQRIGLRKSSLLIILTVSTIIFYLSILHFQSSKSNVIPVLASGVSMPDFTLTDQNLREFNLHAVKGRVVLLFFGYASCPDVCPAVLSKYAILEKLLGDKAERVVMIFVTTDPLRDNAAVLKELASHYSEHIVALTGDWEELEDAWLKYHVMARDTQPPSMTDYYVAHSAIVYVADQDLTLRYILTPEMPVERYYETVNRLLENE